MLDDELEVRASEAWRPIPQQIGAKHAERRLMRDDEERLLVGVELVDERLEARDEVEVGLASVREPSEEAGDRTALSGSCGNLGKRVGMHALVKKSGDQL